MIASTCCSDSATLSFIIERHQIVASPPQRRRRLIEMLRATDGRRAGATYQDIAEAVFGAERESATLWKSMPLRDVVLRRVRTGLNLGAGGYRTLLHKHRAAMTP
ncbi:MAG TPA: DUF2285 domain-containing protein [Mesorhizobium sp.]|jgi:hypothetical protein